MQLREQPPTPENSPGPAHWALPGPLDPGQLVETPCPTPPVRTAPKMWEVRECQADCDLYRNHCQPRRIGLGTVGVEE